MVKTSIKKHIAAVFVAASICAAFASFAASRICAAFSSCLSMCIIVLLLSEIACKVTTFSAHTQIYLQISHVHHLFFVRNSTLADSWSLLMPNSCQLSANTPYFRLLTSKNSPQMLQNGIFSHFLPEKFAYSKN